MRIILLSLFFISTLLGHRLYVLADDDGKILHVKSYFSKSSFCNECQVNVISNGKVINSGKTDKNGEIKFPFKTKNVTIEVIASMGHKGSIDYESENEPVSEDKNVNMKKILLALGILAGIFLLLKVFKR